MGYEGWTAEMNVETADTPDRKVVVFKTVGERSLVADLYPPTDAAGKSPVFLYFHGGGWKNGSKSEPLTFASLIGRLRADGVALISVGYRRTRDGLLFPTPVDDCIDAARFFVKNAGSFGFDADRFFVGGASAGGHLAASTGTISDDKPAFMILFYPVITAEKGKLHKKSFECLLGKGYSAEKARNYSLEKRVSALTPPTLLLLSDDDRIVPPVNSMLFYQALKRNGVKASMHVFPTGDHGWGIKPEFKYIDQWKAYVLDWLEQF